MATHADSRIKTPTEKLTFSEFFTLYFKPTIDNYGFPSYEKFMGDLSKRNSDMSHSIQIGISSLMKEFIRFEKTAIAQPEKKAYCEEEMHKQLAIHVIHLEYWANALRQEQEQKEANLLSSKLPQTRT
ncbi:MAG: hypothetical protein KGH71_02980 [Candidatus Micrarchaeota archaeon]|nr:hypothetical protein [Candidatus Micrarchaeota archaeon]